MDSTEFDEDKPFLCFEGDRPGNQEFPEVRDRLLRTRFLKIHSVLFAFHVALLFLNVALFIRATTSTDIYRTNNELNSVAFEKTFSPAESAIRYTVEELEYAQTPSPFVGKPRPELDRAWSQLLRSILVRISEDEMKRMNKTSVTLQDGSGYVGYLESLHMLHCVKRFYESRYPEHYPDVQEDDGFSEGHLDHCVEVLRQGIMCNADVTINTFSWDNPSKLEGNRSGPRKCVDWNSIQAWADERRLGFDELLPGGVTFERATIYPTAMGKSQLGFSKDRKSG
ncbi:hypothetical protein F4818DRAFT_445058 [Hypoxylon cercidicola]|nr:hypothetical protein F4818DRAFT_445058 [Hypoxylon cercidicola]